MDIELAQALEENAKLKKYIKLCDEANEDLRANNKALRRELNKVEEHFREDYDD